MAIQTFQTFDILCILSLIGGLALFLFGMNSMGQGLEKLSGSSLERILEKLTSNPIKSVILGALVTAVIQSSSATTVMVVGFVNSGIMKLSQAVGVIMGANIGTTMTAWILSLTGVEGEGVMAFFKPSFFTPILAILGMVLVMMSKSAKKKDIGNILVGFAILMTGMNLMSAAVNPLKTNTEFQSILTMFSNPLLGVLAGAVLTAIIQSSSASVAILQAVASTGAINFNSAIPILMGQNIGTCITALLSSVGANKNAKRAALIHLYFNIIGTIIFMVLFYAVTSVVEIAILDGPVTETG
ncbi:MAG: Na/Pi cotransporter family protein, partial [Ruminiclostridium sp.]|nr:Na/Pi cotransporter family protein [Ruminiclostridium sp.]